MFTGHGTTCNLLSFAVVLLHLNPNILERWMVPAPISNDYDGFFSVCRLQSEVDEVLGNKESVNAEDLTNLQYTEQVCLL